MTADAGGGGGSGNCVAGMRAFDDTVDNARDLGGIAAGGNTTRCNAIYRGAVPGSVAACQAMSEFGVKTVIDLRTDEERASAPSCFATAVNATMPIPYTLSAQEYLTDFRTDASVKKVFEILGSEASYPVFIHCTYGRDRTGVVAAMVLLALGVSREDVMTDYLRTRDEGYGASPASLDAVLDEIERLGGIDAHLLSIGVTAKQLAVLQGSALQ